MRRREDAPKLECDAEERSPRRSESLGEFRCGAAEAGLGDGFFAV